MGKCLESLISNSAVSHTCRAEPSGSEPSRMPTGRAERFRAVPSGSERLRSVPCPAGAQGALCRLPAAAGSAMAERPGAPAGFGRPAALPQTGWERLSELWRRDELQQYPEETVNIAKSAFTAGLVGWLYGGLPAFVNARKAFIERSHGELFQNRADAVQSAHRAGLRSFIRYGWRWSWRVAAFATIFNVVSTGLSAYRDKTTISNFAAAGGSLQEAS